MSLPSPDPEARFAGLHEAIDGIVTQDTFDYETRAGNKEARQYLYVLRGYRGQIETRRKEAKKGALEWGRRIDATAKKLTRRLDEMMEPHVQALKVIDDREKRRIARHKSRLLAFSIENLATDSKDLRARLDEVRGVVLDDFEEFQERAKQEQALCVATLVDRIVEAEAEEAREREAERLRKREAAREAEAEKLRREVEIQEREQKAAQRAREEAEARHQKEMEKERNRATKLALEAKLEASEAKRQAEEAERKRLQEAAEEQERQRKAEAELRARERDNAHRDAVMTDIVTAFLKNGADLATAESLVGLMVDGKIPHVHVQF